MAASWSRLSAIYHHDGIALVHHCMIHTISTQSYKGRNMSKRKNAIIFVLCVILILLSSYVIVSEYNKNLKRETFINEIYYLLKDCYTEMENQDPEALKSSPDLRDILVELDVRCLLHSQEMWNKFSYPRPGTFDLIKSKISNGIYTQDELQSLSIAVQQTVEQLSDETGNSENSDLSYKEINSILGELFETWWNS